MDMHNRNTLAMMLAVSGGLTAAIAAPSAAYANCGAYSAPHQSTSSFGAEKTESPEQREARLAQQKAERAARKEAKLAKKAAKEQAAAAAKAAAVASN
jgi:hypothetical protein